MPRSGSTDLDRLTTRAVAAYVGLSVLHWWHVSLSINGHLGAIGCGNGLGDPFLFLANVVGPVTLGCSAARAIHEVRMGRRPGRRIGLSMPIALGTSAALVVEGFLLDGGYGFDLIGGTWWLSWLASPS